jgi:TatD DNase family protein
MVDRFITVGTDVKNSQIAVDFAAQHSAVWALVGVHPSVTTEQDIVQLEEIITRHHPVGLGDIGLDYHYRPYNRQQQIALLVRQLTLAEKYGLPVSFHVREAFDDFWAIFDSFRQLRGTLHSYTDNQSNLEKGLSRGLFVSVNGIATFNREPELARAYDAMPLDRLMFETDAPYLAPKPFRGKQNQPAYIRQIAEFWADKYKLEFSQVAQTTTENVKKLFKLGK